MALISSIDARVVYSKTYEKMKERPDWVTKAKPILYCWHEYEARYGDLDQVKQVEARMMELYPNETSFSLFARRHAGRGFDICAAKPIISYAAQKKPRAVSSIELAAAVNAQDTPALDIASTLKRSLSPKRSLEDSDNELQPPRKLPRADSPLKGAAGRRMDAARRSGLRNEARANGANSSTPSHMARPMAPASLPGPLMHLLAIIPRSSAYTGMKLNPERMTDLIRNVDMGKAAYAGAQQQNTAPAPPPPYPQHMSVPPAMPLQPQMTPYAPAPAYGYGQPAGHGKRFRKKRCFPTLRELDR